MIEQNNLIPNYAVYMQDIMFIEIRDLKRGGASCPLLCPPHESKYPGLFNRKA